jgi:hypothetical protein
MTNVYIINKSAHNFKATKSYGKTIYLSEGLMDRYATNNIHRRFYSILKDSDPKDYLVLCSLNVMNSIACAIFTKLHGELNLLLYKKGNNMTTYQQGLQDCLDLLFNRITNGPSSGFDGAAVQKGLVISWKLIKELQRSDKDGYNTENSHQVAEGSIKAKR